MTIICIKDGVVAADSASFSGAVVVGLDERKVRRSMDGAVGAS